MTVATGRRTREPRPRGGARRVPGSKTLRMWIFTLGRLPSYERPALRHDRAALTTNALARLAVTLLCARRLPTN